MRTIADLGAEQLARPERREQLPLLHLLRLYLDPSPLFKNVNAGSPRAQAEALQYNRRNRCILLAYARRWGMIALTTLLGITSLGASAPSDPLLCVPMLALGLVLALAVAAVLVHAAVYLVLGFSERR